MEKNYKMKKRNNKPQKSISMEDYIKAVKRGNRMAEQELLGPGFHSSDRTHRSKKLYVRKQKHKDTEEWFAFWAIFCKSYNGTQITQIR